MNDPEPCGGRSTGWVRINTATTTQQGRDATTPDGDDMLGPMYQSLRGVPAPGVRERCAYPLQRNASMMLFHLLANQAKGKRVL
jgi:hypothetical protein